MKQTDEPLVMAYCHMAIYVMYGKEEMLSIQQAVRRLMKKFQTKTRFIDFEDFDWRDYHKLRDPLAERFLSTVERLSDLVLTNRERVLSINKKLKGSKDE